MYPDLKENDVNDYNFGNFVCQLREKNGLTQAEVASRLGVTAAAVSKWENGSSKPRVEILFQLAEMLGVRPEELMVGHYIEDEGLDPEAVRQINQRYEYLRRIDMHNEIGTKIRRLVAWLIDWNLIGVAVLFASSFYLAFVLKEDSSNTEKLILLFIILAFPVCFVLRDLLLGGRSLGKRILRLAILSTKTGDVPQKTQLFMRNVISIFVIHIDAIIMLATGLSIGDRAAHTVVVSKKDLNNSCKPYPVQQKSSVSDRIYDPKESGLGHLTEPKATEASQYTEPRATVSDSYKASEISQYPEQRAARSAQNKKAMVILFCVLGVAFVLFLVFAIHLASTLLDLQKNTEEYKLAYTYLIESEEFKALGIDEEDVRLASSKTYRTTKDGADYYEAEFGFVIGFSKELYVICHNEGDGWFVCTECTDFK